MSGTCGGTGGGKRTSGYDRPPAAALQTTRYDSTVTAADPNASAAQAGPVSTGRAPADPASTGPGLTGHAPVEPASTGPDRADSAPADSAPAGSSAAGPNPVDSAPADPAQPAAAGAVHPPPSAALPLAGRTVLVTGGAHRVGGAISRHLGGLGARIVVHYHSSRDEAEALVGELPYGGRALAADLEAADGAAGLLAACAAAGDLPDAVVHSAASFLRRRVEETTVEEWDAVFALNLRAFFLLARELALRVAAHETGGVEAGEVEAGGVEAGGVGTGGAGAGGVGTGGAAAGAAAAAAGQPRDRVLIAISDSGAYELWPGYAAHCTAKAALLPLVRVLAKSLAPAIRVNAVVPGPVLPEPGSDERQVEAMASRTLVQRIGDPSDVAHAVAFLLTSPFTTGSVVDVTGGAHLWRGSRGRDTPGRGDRGAD